MIRRDRFGNKDWETAIPYHLNGFAEAAATLGRLLKDLDQKWDRPDQDLTQLLADIDAQFWHASFHEKALRRPLARLVDRYHSGVAGDGKRKGKPGAPASKKRRKSGAPKARRKS